MGDTCMNHIIYTNDTTLLDPSPAARKKLLEIATQFTNESELVANMKKTKCMAIKLKCDKSLHVSTLYINEEAIETASKESYLGVDITEDFKDDRATMEKSHCFYLQLLLVLLICDTSIMSSLPLVCMLFLSYLLIYTYLYMK